MAVLKNSGVVGLCCKHTSHLINDPLGPIEPVARFRRFMMRPCCILHLISNLSTTLRSCRAAAPLPDWCRQTCCRVVVLALKSEWFTTKGMLLVCINHQRNLCPVHILPICSLNMIIRISIVIVWDITSDWHSIWVCATSVSYHNGRTRKDMRD